MRLYVLSMTQIDKNFFVFETMIFKNSFNSDIDESKLWSCYDPS